MRVTIPEQRQAAGAVWLVGALRKEYGVDKVTQTRGYSGSDNLSVVVQIDAEEQYPKVRSIAKQWVELKTRMGNEPKGRQAVIKDRKGVPLGLVFQVAE